MFITILVSVAILLASYKTWNKDRETAYLLLAFWVLYLIGFLVFGLAPDGLVDK